MQGTIQQPYRRHLLQKLGTASKGQRDAMYYAAKRMKMISDMLSIPIVITSAFMGSALLSEQVNILWAKYVCASIAFLNTLLLTIQKVTRPGERGEMYQSYGRKWDIFSKKVLTIEKWGCEDPDQIMILMNQLDDNGGEVRKEDGLIIARQSEKGINVITGLVQRYNAMIDQSPLLPDWATMTKFQEVNDDLSSTSSSDTEEEQEILCGEALYLEVNPDPRPSTEEAIRKSIEPQ